MALTESTIQFTIERSKYIVKSKVIKNEHTNYCLSVQLLVPGDPLPIQGTILNEKTSLVGVFEWALRTATRREEELKNLFNNDPIGV